jgi:hypothetical protein
MSSFFLGRENLGIEAEGYNTSTTLLNIQNSPPELIGSADLSREPIGLVGIPSSESGFGYVKPWALQRFSGGMLSFYLPFVSSNPSAPTLLWLICYPA